MAVDHRLRHPVHAYVHPQRPVAGARAASRMSAYVYGDVLALAATLGVTEDDIRSGSALLVVVGTMVSTYVAHVLADVVGEVFAGNVSRTLLGHETRDSIPVISAAAPSLVLLGAAALGWPPPLWAQAIASAVLILRLAALGLVYRRLHPALGIGRAFTLGLCIALTAGVVAALKLTLTH